MTLYYLLKEGDTIRHALTKHSPIADQEAEAIFTKLSKTISGIVRGSLVVAGIEGVLAGIGFAFFGIPNPSLWAILTAVAALVPGVGTMLVMAPAIIFLFVTGNVGGGIGLALWYLCMLALVDNFLAPKIMSKGSELHPLLILLSVLGGVAYFGPVGIFMGPLTISFLFAVYTTYASATAQKN
jgi:predicted PurR-regulated permease PerM